MYWSVRPSACADELRKLNGQTLLKDWMRKLIRLKVEKHIPRGYRQNFIPGQTRNQVTKYEELYSKDPFSDKRITCGTMLMTKLTRQKKWIETHVSLIQNAVIIVKKLDGDPKQIQKPSKATANQEVHQLLLNGKPTEKVRKHHYTVRSAGEITILHLPLQ